MPPIWKVFEAEVVDQAHGQISYPRKEVCRDWFAWVRYRLAVNG